MKHSAVQLLLSAVLCAIIIFSIPSSAAAGVVYVKWDSPGTGSPGTFDGRSWETAFHKVQEGINAALSGDEVWVSAGTYVENVTLKSGVGLYGGFAGTETARTQRNWKTNATVLDGNNSQKVVTAPSGTSLTTVISGFTIRNGANGISVSSSSVVITNNTVTGNRSSGISCSSSSPTIADNAITGNGGDFGGGISCYFSSPLIANNTIIGNGGDYGGGIYFSSSSPTITNNIIAFNSSGVRKSTETGTPVLKSNCVYGNSDYAYSGLAAGIGDISADPKLVAMEYSQIHIQPGSPCIDAGDDTAVVTGWSDIDGQSRMQSNHIDIGADESDGTTWAFTFTPVVVRVSPAGNDANDGSTWALAKKTVQAGADAASLVGGEVWVAAGIYTQNLVLGPYAYLYGGFAGAETSRETRSCSANRTILDGGNLGPVVQAHTGARLTASGVDGFTIRNGRSEGGAGVDCSLSSPTIANNNITRNNGCGVYCWYSWPNIISNSIHANAGPGIYCSASSPSIINNTISGHCSSSGGGIYCSSSSPTITNNIIAFNSSGVYQTGGTPVLKSNCVYGNSDYDYSGLSAGAGDISADPKFVTAEYSQNHVQPGSPCIDAGDDSAVGIGWLDVDGQLRIQGAHVDMGADESDGTSGVFTPAIVRVSPNGNDVNDGSTWALAKKTVQAGASAASAAGGEVWVAAGTYNERITLGTCAYLYGGFTGTETSRGSRNWRINLSILDGANAGNVITAASGHRLSGIDGFTIQKGVSTTGGGIYCRSSSPTITNNTITRCFATNGGGICCQWSSPTITNNVITSCGSGIYCSSGSPRITNNTIAYCSGRGVYCTSASPTIANNIIAFNSGGLYKESASGTPVLMNNCLYRNYPDYSGLTVGPGDISANPLFVKNTSGDYHLTALSPCINKGLNAAAGLPTFDYDGEGRIFGGTVDIGADEYWSSDLRTAEVKKAPEGAVIKFGATPVSANWSDFFYIEAEDRSGGIRVDKAGHLAVQDGKASSVGRIKTGDNGERYVAASTVTPETGTSVVKPFALANRNLGGGIAGLQDGVWSNISGNGYQAAWVQSTSMNNIGLLVTTFGTVTYAGTDYFYIDDGSALNDGSDHIGVKVSAAGLTFPSTGFVTVTGISSCEKNAEGKLLRLLRVRAQDDIVTH